MAEVDVANNLLRSNVDDHQVRAVGSGLANAGVAVDGHIGQPAIGRSNHLMACYAALGNRRDDLSGRGIDDGETCVSLLRNQQPALLRKCCGDRERNG